MNAPSRARQSPLKIASTLELKPIFLGGEMSLHSSRFYLKEISFDSVCLSQI